MPCHSPDKSEPEQSLEYQLDFFSKTGAEEAADFLSNQPGYLGCELRIPCPDTPHWQVRVLFAEGKATLPLDPGS